MDYRKLDSELLEPAQKCLKIHERLHSEGFHDMTGEEFADLYNTNLNNYIAFIAHAMFESGLQDAVIILGDVFPARSEQIKALLDHEKGGLRFTKTYAEDIALCKRKVIIQVFYLDGSNHYAMFGVKGVAAKEFTPVSQLNILFN
jgi:hypothetical protein